MINNLILFITIFANLEYNSVINIVITMINHSDVIFSLKIDKVKILSLVVDVLKSIPIGTIFYNTFIKIVSKLFKLQ